MALTINSKAPDFTLKQKTESGLRDIRLSERFGKRSTILLFFPFAFTGVCTDEMCTVSQGIDAYAALDADVFAISVDSPFAQEAWANAHNIAIPLLSDFNKCVSGAYDVLYEDFAGFKEVAKRSAFVIGKDGVIRYSWSSEDPKDLPDFEVVRAAI
ncbi:MAG TPA: peroxiredoxin [Opitutae bacterium]|nr:peroxiredoxin [Opitutae bacterium]|tara:strand:- start:589 stop:1056 length:468 start_codon:yes stop_codon:yes gene_type:complete